MLLPPMAGTFPTRLAVVRIGGQFLSAVGSLTLPLAGRFATYGLLRLTSKREESLATTGTAPFRHHDGVVAPPGPYSYETNRDRHGPTPITPRSEAPAPQFSPEEGSSGWKRKTHLLGQVISRLTAFWLTVRPKGADHRWKEDPPM